jgi:hypothetical protein
MKWLKLQSFQLERLQQEASGIANGRMHAALPNGRTHT